MSAETFRELFPDSDYRFRPSVRRGDTAQFFAPGHDHADILRERRQWLAETPRRYARLTASGGPLLAAFHALASTWDQPARLHHDCVALASALEPDFLLLARDAHGVFRLEGGGLCFPTGWDLGQKLGGTLESIHGIVPGLNAALGLAIARLLDSVAEGATWERTNWGLAATAERNLHPALARPRLGPDCEPCAVWLRVERQLLAPLPVGPGVGVLFAIRVELTPLPDVLADSTTRRGFARALSTMPDDVAHYKGLLEARPRLLAFAGV